MFWYKGISVPRDRKYPNSIGPGVITKKYCKRKTKKENLKNVPTFHTVPSYIGPHQVTHTHTLSVQYGLGSTGGQDESTQYPGGTYACKDLWEWWVVTTTYLLAGWDLTVTVVVRGVKNYVLWVVTHLFSTCKYESSNSLIRNRRYH